VYVADKLLEPDYAFAAAAARSIAG
jgi:hypothetical protein